MTQAQIKELLKKVEMLDAKIAILQDEATGIKMMLQDIVDPENKKAKAVWEKREKKALMKASMEARVKMIMERRMSRPLTQNQLNARKFKEMLDAGADPEDIFKQTGIIPPSGLKDSKNR